MTDENEYDAGADVAEPEQSPDLGADNPAPKKRGWAARLVVVGLWAVAAVAVLGILGVLLYNFGTMETPTAAEEAQYQRLVDSGAAQPLPPSPGLRIPIPGCTCHAADANIAQKVPGRQPDVTLVMAHRYRTLSQCGQCHGNGKEPPAIEGQPTEDAPAQ